MSGLYTILLLIASNVFMTLAWYLHLKLSQTGVSTHWPLIAVIAFSWGIAFIEYCFMIPANRIGFVGNGGPFSLMQLKIIQEVLSLVIFTIIANILFHLGIPYKYECPLRSGFRKLYPDFTILDVRRRKEIYWEHFGKADDENYATNAITKLAAYSSMCVDVGGDLIVTCETSGSPLDTDNVMSILSERGLIPDSIAA